MCQTAHWARHIGINSGTVLCHPFNLAIYGSPALFKLRLTGEGVRSSLNFYNILDPANVVRRDDDDFADLKACFNPIYMIDPFDPEAVDQAARIADSLIEPSSNDPFWSNAARD